MGLIVNSVVRLITAYVELQKRLHLLVEAGRQANFEGGGRFLNRAAVFPQVFVTAIPPAPHWALRARNFI